MGKGDSIEDLRSRLAGLKEERMSLEERKKLQEECKELERQIKRERAETRRLKTESSLPFKLFKGTIATTKRVAKSPTTKSLLSSVKRELLGDSKKKSGK